MRGRWTILLCCVLWFQWFGVLNAVSHVRLRQHKKQQHGSDIVHSNQNIIRCSTFLFFRSSSITSKIGRDNYNERILHWLPRLQRILLQGARSADVVCTCPYIPNFPLCKMLYNNYVARLICHHARWKLMLSAEALMKLRPPNGYDCILPSFLPPSLNP